MENTYSQHIQMLIDAGTNVVLKYGDPGVGKTCFLMTLYEYVRMSPQWYGERNVEGNFEKIRRLKDFLDRAKENGQLPLPTTPGEVHELDLLLTEIKEEGLAKLFTFLDISGEDCSEFIQKGKMKNHILQFLIEELRTTFIYLVKYEEGKKKDHEVGILLDYLKGNAHHHFDRFAIVITQWDRNTQKDGTQIFRSLEDYLSKEMKETYKMLHLLLRLNYDVKAFNFSIGEVVTEQSSSRKLNGELNLSYCPSILEWLHANGELLRFPPETLNEPLNPPKQPILSKFMNAYKAIWTAIIGLFSIIGI